MPKIIKNYQNQSINQKEKEISNYQEKQKEINNKKLKKSQKKRPQLSEAEIFLEELLSESRGPELINLCKSKDKSQKIQKMLRKEEVKVNAKLKWKLIKNLRNNFPELMTDNYGNFVFQGLICNAGEGQIDFILEKVVFFFL